MESASFDNRTRLVKDDLVAHVRAGDRVCVAASLFSMYAYRELKDQLEGLAEFRFIFTDEAFTPDRAPKEKREFYIPRLAREQGLCGTEFEIRLKNELTQKAVSLGVPILDEAAYRRAHRQTACRHARPRLLQGARRRDGGAQPQAYTALLRHERRGAVPEVPQAHREAPEALRLDGRCRKEVHPARKRALHEQARSAQQQADRLEREWEQGLL